MFFDAHKPLILPTPTTPAPSTTSTPASSAPASTPNPFKHPHPHLKQINIKASNPNHPEPVEILQFNSYPYNYGKNTRLRVWLESTHKGDRLVLQNQVPNAHWAVPKFSPYVSVVILLMDTDPYSVTYNLPLVHELTFPAISEYKSYPETYLEFVLKAEFMLSSYQLTDAQWERLSEFINFSKNTLANLENYQKALSVAQTILNHDEDIKSISQLATRILPNPPKTETMADRIVNVQGSVQKINETLLQARDINPPPNLSNVERAPQRKPGRPKNPELQKLKEELHQVQVAKLMAKLEREKKELEQLPQQPLAAQHQLAPAHKRVKDPITVRFMAEHHNDDMQKFTIAERAERYAAANKMNPDHNPILDSSIDVRYIPVREAFTSKDWSPRQELLFSDYYLMRHLAKSMHEGLQVYDNNAIPFEAHQEKNRQVVIHALRNYFNLNGNGRIAHDWGPYNGERMKAGLRAVYCQDRVFAKDLPKEARFDRKSGIFGTLLREEIHPLAFEIYYQHEFLKVKQLQPNPLLEYFWNAIMSMPVPSNVGPNDLWNHPLFEDYSCLEPELSRLIEQRNYQLV